MELLLCSSVIICFILFYLFIYLFYFFVHLDDTSFVVQHILEMKLFVQVVWVGPNLNWLADTLTARYLNEKANRSLVLLSYMPSTITMWGNSKFMTVAFPPCETLQSSQSVGCKYELHRLVKLVWSQLEVGAKPAYEVKDNFFSILHCDWAPAFRLTLVLLGWVFKF